MGKGKSCQTEMITAFPGGLVEGMKREGTGITKVGMTESGFLWGFPEHLFWNFTVGGK